MITMKLLKRSVTNFFFPPRCVFCDRVREINQENGSCTDCDRILKKCNRRLCCQKCGKPVVSVGKRGICYFCANTTPLYYNRIVSCFEYRGKVKEAVLRYKKIGIQSYAPAFAKYLAERLWEEYKEIKFDLICAVPSHTKKGRSLGFDNIELLSKNLSKITNFPFHRGVIRKIRKTPGQTGMDFQERMDNLGKSMTAKSSRVAGKNILLVDDTCTTRATLIETSRALKTAGAKGVFALTLATTAKEKLFFTSNEEPKLL